MTTGEGGLVVTSDKDYARWMILFSDKAWGYGDPKPDHYFLALNYRMTDLQGAVARAQLAKLDGVVERRRKTAEQLTERLQGTPGLVLPKPAANATHVYWKYPLIVDPAVIQGGSGRARRRPQGQRRVLRAALHPEAGLRVRGLHQAQDLRPEPVPLLPPRARGRHQDRVRRRASTRARCAASSVSSCCRGTSSTPISTSPSSRMRCRMRVAELTRSKTARSA